MRAFFGLKRVVMRSRLSFKALTTLFDSLIKPIVMYGAPIWMPSNAITKSLTGAINLNSYNIKSVISKINRTNPEKIHLPFLKWALGVHRKSSNIGVWGESGRYPIIYQCIRLSINYYTRLTKLDSSSFVFAALQEQKRLNLPWYKNIESLLKLDEIYFKDHVTAHRIMNFTSCVVTHPQAPLESLKDLKCATPLPSKCYRVNQISDTLSTHFKACWEHEKSVSSKLSFYHVIKKKFARESYLDIVNKFSHRYSTTKLRISAHDLEIETGRYHNIPRDQRVCSWCNIRQGQQFIEDENHVLFNCDMYAKIRSSFINSLNKTPKIDDKPTTAINHSSLKLQLMNLLSPNTVYEIHKDNTNQFNQHHTNLNLEPKSPSHTRLIEARSHIINKVCWFISRCREERWKCLKESRSNDKRNLKTITISITRTR